MFGRYAAKFFSSMPKLRTGLVSSRLYFLDTNIAICYMKSHDNSFDKAVKSIFDSSNSKLYYTETVRAKLEEKLDGETIPARFSYKESGLNVSDADYALKIMQELIAKRVQSGELPFRTTEIHWEKYRNDFRVIFEAGFAGYDPDINEGLQQPVLLTRDLKFYNLVHNRFPGLIEDAINMSGLEHLVEVENMNNIVSTAELTGKNSDPHANVVMPTKSL